MEAENKQELMKLATLHYNAENYEEALETYKKALTIDPSYLSAKHGLARSLASLRRCKEALEEFDWVLRHDGLSNAWYSELYKQRGDVYFELQISGSLRGKFWFYDEVLQNFLHALDDRALTLNRKNEEAARMKAQVTEYYLQQREKLGDDADLSELDFYDERFGYTAYKKLNEASLLERTNHVIAFSKTKEQWLQEGINHYLAEDYTNSLRACELAILIDANYARAYYGKGLTLRRYNNDQEALLAFDRAIQLDAAYMKAYYGIGNILYKDYRYEEALAAYDQTIRLNPKHAAAYSGKAGTLFALHRYEEALAAYDQAIQLDPSCVDHYYKKGSNLLELKHEEEAFAVFDQVIHSNPHDFSVYESIAELVAYNGYCEKGLAIYYQAIRLNLNNAVAYRRIGEIFQIYLDRNDDALAAYEQVTLLDPDFTFTKASFLFDIYRYDEAARAYEQALQVNSNDITAHFMKGISLLNLARNEEALACFDQVMQLDPDDMFTHHNRGIALFGIGRHEEALAAFKKALSLFYDTNIPSKYFHSRTHYDSYERCWVGTIYAEITKLFTGLAGSENVLADLKQYYEGICKKIEKNVQVYYGWVENDNDEYDEEWDENGPRFTEIPWDYEKEEWLEEMDGYIHEFEEYRRDYG